jgi:hypothetical protein
MGRTGRCRSPDGEPELLVLAASVSVADRRWVERTVKDGGYEVRGVGGADEADEQIDGRAAARCVLVIDSGLLEMAHDGAWRDLRTRHPGLRVVVRCLIAREPGLQRMEAHTVLVHPDSAHRLLEAVDTFQAAAADR